MAFHKSNCYPASDTSGTGYCFRSISLFLCFFVSKITSKRLDRFAWNFHRKCGVTMGPPDYIFGRFRETARCRDAQHGGGVCCTCFSTTACFYLWASWGGYKLSLCHPCYAHVCVHVESKPISMIQLLLHAFSITVNLYQLTSQPLQVRLVGTPDEHLVKAVCARRQHVKWWRRVDCIPRGKVNISVLITWHHRPITTLRFCQPADHQQVQTVVSCTSRSSPA